jgi:hypothetical protein
MKFNYVQKSAQALRISVKNKIFHTQDPCLHTNSRCTKNSSRMEIIMELLEIAKKRHSVRKYTGKEIEQEKLDKMQ